MQESGGREGLWLPNLKAERLRAGMRQEDLQTESGVSRGTLVKLETGRKPVQARTARRLAEALKVSIRHLEGAEEGLEGSGGRPNPVEASVSGSRQSSTEQGDVDRITVYIRGRTEEEVVEEVRERYRDKTLAAWARSSATEHPEPEAPETDLD